MLANQGLICQNLPVSGLRCEGREVQLRITAVAAGWAWLARHPIRPVAISPHFEVVAVTVTAARTATGPVPRFRRAFDVHFGILGAVYALLGFLVQTLADAGQYMVAARQTHCALLAHALRAYEGVRGTAPTGIRRVDCVGKRR